MKTHMIVPKYTGQKIIRQQVGKGGEVSQGLPHLCWLFHVSWVLHVYPFVAHSSLASQKLLPIHTAAFLFWLNCIQTQPLLPCPLPSSPYSYGSAI
jgi:hypothetical protein